MIPDTSVVQKGLYNYFRYKCPIERFKKWFQIQVSITQAWIIIPDTSVQKKGLINYSRFKCP